MINKENIENKENTERGAVIKRGMLLSVGKKEILISYIYPSIEKYIVWA